MNYIKVTDGDDAGLKVAVTKKFQREYFKTKALVENANDKLKKIQKMPILDKENLKGMLNLFKIRAKKNLEKAEKKVKKQEKKFAAFEKEFNALKREAKDTPELQKAKIKYPSIGNDADTILEKNKRKRILILAVVATVVLTAAVIILTGGIAAPVIAGLAIAAPLISGLAVSAPIISGLAAAAIALTGAVVSGLIFRGLKKYKKTESNIKREKDLKIQFEELVRENRELQEKNIGENTHTGHDIEFKNEAISVLTDDQNTVLTDDETIDDETIDDETIDDEMTVSPNYDMADDNSKKLIELKKKHLLLLLELKKVLEKKNISKTTEKKNNTNKQLVPPATNPDYKSVSERNVDPVDETDQQYHRSKRRKLKDTRKVLPKKGPETKNPMAKPKRYQAQIKEKNGGRKNNHKPR